MLAQRVRLRLCFAFLRICDDECRDWAANGDIYDFTCFYRDLFVIHTCLLDGDDCHDVEVQLVLLKNR